MSSTRDVAPAQPTSRAEDTGDRRGPTAANRRRSRLLAIARLTVPLVVVLAWLVAGPRTSLLPTFQSTMVQFGTAFTEGWVYTDLRATGTAVAVGFVIGSGIGFPLGYALGRSRPLTRVLEPIVAGTFAVPRIILYPILLTLFGVGLTAEISMVAISTFFPILMSTLAAVAQVRGTLVKLGHSLALSRLQMATKIVLPAAAPSLMVGIRIGFSISFIAAIIAEFFAAKSGLGLVIANAYGLLQLDRMFAAILMVMIIAIGGNLVLWWIERRLQSAMT